MKTSISLAKLDGMSRENRNILAMLLDQMTIDDVENISKRAGCTKKELKRNMDTWWAFYMDEELQSKEL